MKLLAISISIILICSCSKTPESPISKKLKLSDSVVVQFYGEKQVLENAATSTIRASIQKLIGFIDSKPADSSGCVRSGQLIFFAGKKELQRVIYKSACRQFEYDLDGKKNFSEMSEDGVKYLNGIRKGEY